MDIDLSILGAPVADYDLFEKDVRREYHWVPWFLYRKKRTAMLRSLLARPSIYALPPYTERFEAQARVNLQRAIETLQP